jgi:hypothetical protein
MLVSIRIIVFSIRNDSVPLFHSTVNKNRRMTPMQVIFVTKVEVM